MWGKDSQQRLCDKSDFFHYPVASHTVHSCGAGPGATCITLLPPSSWWPLEMGQDLPKACLWYPCHPTTPTPLPAVGSRGLASSKPPWLCSHPGASSAAPAEQPGASPALQLLWRVSFANHWWSCNLLSTTCCFTSITGGCAGRVLLGISSTSFPLQIQLCSTDFSAIGVAEKYISKCLTRLTSANSF